MTDIDPHEEGQKPVPEAWRPILKAVADALAAGDFALACGIEGVESPDAATVEHMRDHVADYGEQLVELPDETWQSSVVQDEGEGLWSVLVDLWTAAEGRSDLVLSGHMEVRCGTPRFTIHMVYVP